MPSSTVHASLIGRHVGAYKVEALIGRGAMGTVYLAYDEGLKRNVALKVLLGSVAQDSESVKRFHREAQAAAPLKHPGIVRIYGAGLEDGVPYIAMEYVEGEPLDRFLRRKERIEWENALLVAHQLADALDCAHSHKVVHRDIKPANVMLDRFGRVRLCDFGIANVQTEEGGEGPQFFTPQYMSPEQCRGGEVGPASDLFSLGVVMYKMMAGVLPFEGDTPTALMNSISNDDAMRLNKIMPEVPDDVARLVAFLMEKEPGKRPSSARAVCEILDRITSGEGGASVMAEALAAFIREQAEPRAIGGASKPRTGTTRRLPPRRAVREIIRDLLTWETLWPVAVAAAGVVLVLLLPWIQSLTGRTGPNQAPLVAGVAFERNADGIVLAQLPNDGFRFASMSWLPDRAGLLASLEGVPGTLAQGGWSVVTVELLRQRVFSSASPSAPGLDPYHGVLRFAPPHNVTVNTRPPLDFMMLYPVYADVSAREQGEVLLVAQRWDALHPMQAPLYRSPADHWVDPAAPPWANRPVGRALLSPDGRRLCLALRDPVVDQFYLLETRLTDGQVVEAPYRLTDGLDGLQPDSVRYSPDGEQVLYLRSMNDQSEFWLVKANGRERNGIPVALGRLLPQAAFSPDARFIAVNSWTGQETEPELRVIDTVTGRTAARLGTGWIHPESWHPRGDFLLVASRFDGFGDQPNLDYAQMWAVETASPYRRHQLTDVIAGIRGGCAVSTDGTLAVAVMNNDLRPTLVFAPLRGLGEQI